MKNIISISFLFLAFFATAQAPQGLNYQAIYRNAQGNPIANQNVNVQFSILDGSVAGPAVYVENHVIITNPFGLFTLTIGQGSPVLGLFSNVNWGNSSKFLKVEANNSLLGTTQLMSVPYALYAAKTNIQAGAGIDINGSIISNTGDLSDANELQNLSISGNTLSISDGNSVMLPISGNSQWTTIGNDIYYNSGKVLIGSDTPIDPYPGTVLQIASDAYESALHLYGINGGSNYNNITLREMATNSGWTLTHKATGGINHQLMFEYLDGETNTYNYNTLKIAPTGNTGFGMDYNDIPQSRVSVKGGDINILDIGSGVIMKSPNGNCWRMTVTDAGQPQFTSITCPQ